MKSLLPSWHLIILLLKYGHCRDRKRKRYFPTTFYIGCVWEANADNLLVCLQGIIQPGADTRASENSDRLADCWTHKQQHGLKLKGSVFFPDCGCGFINLWLPSLSDTLYSCSMLDLFESDCTLSEETDHVEPSCDAQQVELLIRGLFDRNINHVTTAEPVTPRPLPGNTPVPSLISLW